MLGVASRDWFGPVGVVNYCGQTHADYHPGRPNFIKCADLYKELKAPIY